MGISDIARHSMTLLFSMNSRGISDLRTSLVDIKGSLICDLSELNKAISESIESSARLVCSEYADFLIYTINKINGSKFDYNKAKPLVEFINYTSGLSNDMDDEIIASELAFSNKKLQDIVGYDMAKATAIHPIIQSKSNEFIASVKENLESIIDKSSKIRQHIEECSKLIESCDFCKWYLLYTNSRNNEQPPILEKDYDTIISALCAAYMTWKEGEQK